MRKRDLPPVLSYPVAQDLCQYVSTNRHDWSSFSWWVPDCYEVVIDFEHKQTGRGQKTIRHKELKSDELFRVVRRKG